MFSAVAICFLVVPAGGEFSPSQWERNGLVQVGKIDTAFGSVYRYRQTYAGYEVDGAALNVAVSDGKVVALNDKTVEIDSFRPATITLADAEKIATASGGEVVFSTPIIHNNDGFELCYKVKTSGGTEFTISGSGEVIRRTASPLSPIAVMSELYDADGKKVVLPLDYQESEDGDIWFLSDFTKNIYLYNDDARAYYTSADGKFNDGIAVSVYNTLNKAYDFYADKNNLGVEWKGINGKNDDVIYNQDENGEIPLVVYIHYGVDYENANCGYYPAYNQAVMYVGDGKATGSLYRQGRAADVIAHEYQHAISDFAVDGGLTYLNESGAISEAVSDIFGALVEGYELDDDRFWEMGERACPQGALRSMKSPSDGYAMHMSQKKPLCYQHHDHNNGNCDSGSTHENSTILTHVQYRMWRKNPEFFTKERIGKLWFSTLTMLTSNATFEDFAEQMTSAAKLEFGQEAGDLVAESFFESGFGDQSESVIVTYKLGQETLEKTSVIRGESPSEFTLPDKPAEHGVYAFVGWSKDLSSVNTNVTVSPVYKFVPETFEVTFMSEGEVIERTAVAYGGKATPSVMPSKPSTAESEYLFAGWDKPLDNITSDTVFNAVFWETVRKYTVTYVSAGKVATERKVAYGDELPMQHVERAGYRFLGWYLDEDYSVKAQSHSLVSSDLVLYAKWELETYVIIIIVSGAAIASVAVSGCVFAVIRKKRKRSK